MTQRIEGPLFPDDGAQAPLDLGASPPTPQGWRRLSLDDAATAPELTPLEEHRAWLTHELDKIGPPRAHNVPLPQVGAEQAIADVARLRPVSEDLPQRP